MSAITCYDCKILVLGIIQYMFDKNKKLILKAIKEISSNRINHISQQKLKQLLEKNQEFVVCNGRHDTQI